MEHYKNTWIDNQGMVTREVNSNNPLDDLLDIDLGFVDTDIIQRAIKSGNKSRLEFIIQSAISELKYLQKELNKIKA